MASFTKALFFGGTTAIEPTGHDDRILAMGGVDDSDFYDSDADEDIPYENPQTGESYSLKRAGSPKESDRATKSSRVAGGKAAVPKRVVVDYDSDDGRIIALKQQGYADEYVANKLIQEGRIRYQAKTVGSRWLRLRKALEEAENERMDDELSDWHIEEDADLHESVKLVDEKFEADLKKLTEKKWVDVAAVLASRIHKKKYSGRACQARFAGLQDGTALLPIELDADQEGRKRLRDERTVAAKRRRADAAAKARREEERRLARLEAKKLEALEKNQAAILLSRMRAAEKVEQDRMRKERAQDRERMRLAKRAAEAQASAQLKWKTTQRVGEKTLWEGIVGRTWRNSRTLDLGGSVAGDAEADADSDASADSNGEISERAHRHHCGLLGGFSLMQGYVCTYGSTASASAKKGKARMTPVVSAATLADPRSELAEDEVNAILRERGLPAKKAEETHPQAIARLWAADQDLSTTELHDRLRRYFVKIKGTRQEKLQAMAEYEAGEAGA